MTSENHFLNPGSAYHNLAIIISKSNCGQTVWKFIRHNLKYLIEGDLDKAQDTKV